MPTVSGESFDRFGHEAGCDVVKGSERFGQVFEERGTVGDGRNGAVFEGGFVDTGTGLGVPTF